MFHIYSFFCLYLLTLCIIVEARDDMDSPRNWAWNSATETFLNISLDFETIIEENRIVAPVDQLKNMMNTIEHFENMNDNDTTFMFSNRTFIIDKTWFNVTAYKLIGNYSESDTLQQKYVFSEYFLFEPLSNSTDKTEKIAIRIRCTIEATDFSCFVSKLEKHTGFSWTLGLLIILVAILVVIVIFLCYRTCFSAKKLRAFSQRPEASARYTVNA